VDLAFDRRSRGGVDGAGAAKVEIGGFDLIRFWFNIPFDRLDRAGTARAQLLLSRSSSKRPGGAD
jgi:hypothetical protein